MGWVGTAFGADWHPVGKTNAIPSTAMIDCKSAFMDIVEECPLTSVKSKRETAALEPSGIGLAHEPLCKVLPFGIWERACGATGLPSAPPLFCHKDIEKFFRLPDAPLGILSFQTGNFSSPWIASVRPERNAVDPARPYAFVSERERAANGEIVDVATVFLTNRECAWKCLMCDLWKNTTRDSVPVGAIPRQIDLALDELGARGGDHRQIKLYNSGSLFDPRAIPVADHPRIAEQVRRFERVIVECHPALINERVIEFRDRLGDAKLEVAMGLETAQPEVLKRLNKGITLEDFKRAADFLSGKEIDLRVFILVKTPWQSEAEAVGWAVRSVELAIQCGATVAALIPTRFGNGALEELAKRGEFSPPKLATLEKAFDESIRQVVDQKKSTRVFADLWDLGQFSECEHCLRRRRDRLEKMNFSQARQPVTVCGACSQ